MKQSVGGLAAVKDVDRAIKINDLADRLGLDTISLGNVLAFAIAASRNGKLPLSLEWGDGETLAKLVEDIAFRRGVGDLLAEGVRKAAERIGAVDIAVHVKGLEPAGYDPRVLKGMALNYAIGYGGADHLATMAYALDTRQVRRRRLPRPREDRGNYTYGERGYGNGFLSAL
jgi:aldehyde:ferredoxin oxidoreductase